jgi:hypothetical protein
MLREVEKLQLIECFSKVSTAGLFAGLGSARERHFAIVLIYTIVNTIPSTNLAKCFSAMKKAICSGKIKEPMINYQATSSICLLIVIWRQANSNRNFPKVFADVLFAHLRDVR